MHGQVTVDGRELNSPDRFGEWKILGEVDGWFDAPAKKNRGEARDTADGDYGADEFYGIREITLSGRLKAVNHDMAHEAEEWLKSMFLDGSGIMRVHGHGPGQWATVKQNGIIRCRIEPGTDDRLVWQLPLKAEDPYKYGEKRTFSGTVGTPFNVHQRGFRRAWPFITVSGSMPGGYEITLGGNLIEVTRAVTTGNPHTIDTRTGILRVNGSVVTNGLGIAELFQVNPGLPQSAYSLPKTTGTGTVTFSVTDTYI